MLYGDRQNCSLTSVISDRKRSEKGSDVVKGRNESRLSRFEMKSLLEIGNDDVDEPVDSEALKDAGHAQRRQHPTGRSEQECETEVV